MATQEIRADFHQLIDSIQDEQSLHDLYAAVSLYLEQQNILLDTTDSSILSRMRTSLDQAQRGETVSNEEIQQEVRQWLGK